MALQLQSRILWIRAVELVLGIVCFALMKQYGYTPCSYEAVRSSPEKCIIVVEMTTAAVVGFPLIIIPILIISQLKYGTKLDSNIINPMFAFVGFVLFIVAGSFKVNVMEETPEFYSHPTARTAHGAMCIVTSLAFLGELIYWILYKRNDSGDQITDVSGPAFQD